jgi:leader peptidase (prepilin peptidase)/N-methyltransferase
VTTAAPAEVERPRSAPLAPRYARHVAAAAIVVAALVIAQRGADAAALVLAAVAGCLVWLAALDLNFRLLPNRIVLPAAALTFVARSAIAPSHTLVWLGAAVGAAAFLLVPALIKPHALGMGDVKLALLLGAALGWNVAPALLVGLVVSAVVALALVAMRGRAALQAQIPLGPFLAVGAIAVILATAG